MIGYANYLLAWGSIHSGASPGPTAPGPGARWRLWSLAVGGAALLAGLVTSRAFEADIVGSGNTNLPSIVLLAYAAAQAGLVIAGEPTATRLLARPACGATSGA